MKGMNVNIMILVKHKIAIICVLILAIIAVCVIVIVCLFETRTFVMTKVSTRDETALKERMKSFVNTTFLSRDYWDYNYEVSLAKRKDKKEYERIIKRVNARWLPYYKKHPEQVPLVNMDVYKKIVNNFVIYSEGEEYYIYNRRSKDGYDMYLIEIWKKEQGNYYLYSVAPVYLEERKLFCRNNKTISYKCTMYKSKIILDCASDACSVLLF